MAEGICQALGSIPSFGGKKRIRCCWGSAHRPRVAPRLGETTFSTLPPCSRPSSLALWLSTGPGHGPSGAGPGGNPPPQRPPDWPSLASQAPHWMPCSVLRGQVPPQRLLQAEAGRPAAPPARQARTCWKPTELQAAGLSHNTLSTPPRSPQAEHQNPSSWWPDPSATAFFPGWSLLSQSRQISSPCSDGGESFSSASC